MIYKQAGEQNTIHGAQKDFLWKYIEVTGYHYVMKQRSSSRYTMNRRHYLYEV